MPNMKPELYLAAVALLEAAGVDESTLGARPAPKSYEVDVFTIRRLVSAVTAYDRKSIEAKRHGRDKF